MRRAFLSNIILLVFVNVLIKPFFIFGVDLTVQNRVQAGEYGLYFALLNWAYLFQIISDFGLQNYNTRHVSSYPHLLQKYFPNLLLIKLVLSAMYWVVAIAVAWWIGGYGYGALGLLSILLLNQILVQLILFLRSSIAGLGHYRTDSLLSSLDKLLMLVFCGAALWWHSRVGAGAFFPIGWFVLAQTAALVMTVVVVYGVLLRYAAMPVFPVWTGSFRRGWLMVRFLFRQSLPFAVVILLMSAYTRMDSVLLERLLPDGAYHADIFAGGYRLLDALNMFGYLFASLLLPMFTRLHAEKAPLRPLTILSFKLIWVGSFTACTAIFFNSQALIALMFQDKTDLAYRVLVCDLLIWCFLAICTIYIFSTLLTAGQRLREMNRIFIIGLLLDLTLNLCLVPGYKAVGSAVAALSTQVFVAGGMVGLCIRIYGMRPGGRGLARLGLFSGLLLAIGWFFIMPSSWQWPVKFITLLCTGGVLALVTGMLDWREVLKSARRT